MEAQVLNVMIVILCHFKFVEHLFIFSQMNCIHVM